MTVGIFDSGIGGVSVLNEALHRLPNENYIFYADVDHVPYGLKNPDEIVGFADQIASNLISQGVDALVIACNTATSVAAKLLRDKYDIPIIGMEPAVKPAVEEALGKNGRVLVMATPVTIRENKLLSLLQKVDKDHLVDLLPMPGLVRFAETGIFDGQEIEDYIDEQLAIFDRSLYSEVVLGCTHFNYFKPAIKTVFEKAGVSIEMIDGNVGTIKHLAERLGINVLDDVGEVDYDSVSVTYLESGRVCLAENLEKYKRLHERLDMVRAL